MHKNKYPEACNQAGNGERDMDAGQCRALWRAVLANAIDEATRGYFAVSDLDVARVRGWFGTRDFRMVCDLAGLESGAVLRAYQRRAAARGVAL